MNIFKEYTANQKRVRDQIKREKEADKEKHDRMMDRARTRDTRRKNAMTESEIHVRLDHLDGDSRQKKAGAVMRKHERAGHIEYVGNTDKGVVFKAKSKSHADRLHRELKPHATGVEHMNEAMKKTPLGPKGQAAKDHITALGKKHGRSFGDQRLHIYHFPNKYDKKTNAHAKVLDQHQFGGKTEERSAQDPDIKDREGTQPAVYHKGLKKSTKAKRDAHFKKHGKKADDDASAYKDAPGDKKARKGDMPKSKYTKFVDNMMKEGTDFAAHRAAKATAPSDSDRKKMAKVADLLRKEREKKAAMKKEEVERLDELSPQTKASYVQKAGRQLAAKAFKAARDKRQPGQKDKDGPAFSSHVKDHPNHATIAKREKGIDRATKSKGSWRITSSGLDAGHSRDSQKGRMGKSKSHLDAAKDKVSAAAKKIKEEKQKKDHQTISYVTHGGQKGKVQVHKDNAFKALNHYRKNNKSAQFEAMSPEARKAHGRMFKAAAKRKYDADTKAAAQAEREKRLKAKGWVRNDRGGFSKVSEEADKSLAAKAAKSGISVGTLKKVYNRGVAAWKTGHRPGTTPSQWGHARVNAFIAKKKKGGLNHDKDLA